VSLYVDDQKRVITTDARTVSELLATSSIKLSPGDIVEPGGSTSLPSGFFNINVYRARPIVVHDAGRSYQFSSAYQSPHLLAAQAGLALYPEDTYTTSVITDFVSSADIGVAVNVQRAVPVDLHIDGKTQIIRTQAKTVSAALSGAGIKLGLKDTVSMPGSTLITPNLSLDVKRVADITTTLTDSIPFPTKSIVDPTLLKGVTKTQVAGANGSRTAVWNIHYQDGVELHRNLQHLISNTDPVEEVLVVGSKVLFAGSVEYWRPMVESAAATYNLDPNRMLRIMACESGGNATSISKFIVNGQHPQGLFQFLPSTWTANGGRAEDILDGATQIRLAAKKMASDGFSAWQCQ
jgi:uncharacterized protein YabE (DUF348 family)